MKKIIFISFYLITLVLISCNKEQSFDYPIVYTEDVTDITETNALLNAKIIGLGDDPIVESGFIWGIYSNDKNGIKVKNDTSFIDSYTLKTNKKLLPGKTYYVRAYIQNNQVTTYGNEVSFESTHGQIDTGSWYHQYTDMNSGYCVFITSSFIINDIVYFSFENGDLVSYNPGLNKFNHELNNSVLSYADYCTTYDGNAYIFSKNTIYKFSPETKSFSLLSVLNENEIKHWVSGFLIEDNIYIGCGTSSTSDTGYSKDFWKYNITSNSWDKTASFPGEYRCYTFNYNLNNKGFIGGGYNLIQGQWPYPKFNDLWCYHPETDQWIQKESLPFENKELFNLQGTNTASFGYCFYKNELFEYNLIFNYWEKMADLEIDTNLCFPHIFALNGKIYILEVKGYREEKFFNLYVFDK